MSDGMASKEVMKRVFEAIDLGLLAKFYNPMRFSVLCKKEWHSKNGKYKIIATAWNSLEKSPGVNVYSDKGRGVHEYTQNRNLPKYILKKKEEMYEEVLKEWYEQREYLFYTLDLELGRLEYEKIISQNQCSDANR